LRGVSTVWGGGCANLPRKHGIGGALPLYPRKGGLGINENDIAVLGFSAGGILCGKMLLNCDSLVDGTSLDPRYEGYFYLRNLRFSFQNEEVARSEKEVCVCLFVFFGDVVYCDMWRVLCGYRKQRR
jgi:hypothetical protein